MIEKLQMKRISSSGCSNAPKSLQMAQIVHEIFLGMSHPSFLTHCWKIWAIFFSESKKAKGPNNYRNIPFLNSFLKSRKNFSMIFFWKKKLPQSLWIFQDFLFFMKKYFWVCFEFSFKQTSFQSNFSMRREIFLW